MTEHPITPPPKLFAEWLSEAVREHGNNPGTVFALVAEKAAQWGADQELEACCEWLRQQTLCGHVDLIPSLRAACRPKPPSLAETATQELDEAVMRGDCITTTDAMPHLRAALKRLAELEQQATP